MLSKCFHFQLFLEVEMGKIDIDTGQRAVDSALPLLLTPVARTFAKSYGVCAQYQREDWSACGLDKNPATTTLHYCLLLSRLENRASSEV